MDTREAVERAEEIGMLVGQDLADARALALAPVLPQVRGLVHDRIAEVLAAFDDHDATIYRAKDTGKPHDLYRCPDACGGFIGTEAEWKLHLADKLADALAGE